MKFERFFSLNDPALVEKLAEEFNIDKRVMELLVSRGFKTREDISEFLRPNIRLNPYDLKNMDLLCSRIKLAIEKKEKILVFGDYDVDGVSATAIMLKTIKKLGGKANFYLPNRFIDGYGLTNDVIDKIKKKYNPRLIITVDCGIACKNEVDYAKTLGIEIIVTDHHEIPDEIPNGIVVNAKIENQKFAFNGLCGTGLAQKIAEALLGEKEADELLPITAIATIADIVPLVNENRLMVMKGIKLFERHLPVGIKMLLKEVKLPNVNTNSSDISFKIAPKLNASGRMGDATDSLMLYLETDPVKLKNLIQKILAHNTRRQELCNKVYEDCKKALKKVDLSSLRVICLASKAWDQGILGIVCSRLVEEYHRPVFLFSQEKDMLKGSGRSINDINIHEVLSSLKDILETFGGHTMAAGLSLKRNKYEEFSKRLNATIIEKVSENVFMPIEYYDKELSIDELDVSFVKELEKLEPFGCGNPKPKFLIRTEKIDLEPMKFCPQHANVTIAKKLHLAYFNFNKSYNMLRFSKEKSFIVELQNEKFLKGIVDSFKGEKHLTEESHEFIDALEFGEFECGFEKNNAEYKYYAKQELISMVTTSTVFGTCYVATRVKDFDDFMTNYSLENIYNIEFMPKRSNGFNSLILSPSGYDWCKNYKKIVFLSPVLDSGYVAKLNQVCDAEIFVPIDKKYNKNIFKGMNCSREFFGKIFSAIKSKNGKSFYGVFDLFDCINKNKNFSFKEFYCAFMVFKELGIINIKEDDMMVLNIDNSVKTNLNNSKIYNAINLLNNIKESE